MSPADERSTLIHREILQLTVLIVVAAVAFFLTRAVAANNRAMTLDDAREWYTRGQAALAAGDVDRAIDALRFAVIKNREDKQYALALAGALATKGLNAEARSALLALREMDPEDPAVNVGLARLSSREGDMEAAVGYYHNALYAPWPSDQAERRRAVRIELIRFLLARDQSQRALPEIVALATNVPEDAVAHVQVADLFVKAGDVRAALDQFTHALRLAPDNGDAAAGAGRAAFQLGDYAAAGRYLRSAPQGDADTARMRQTADLVLSRDPLASGIPLAERRRRFVDAFTYADQRLAACAVQANPGQAALSADAQAFASSVARPAALDLDTLEAGMNLVGRMEHAVVRSCATTPLDDALLAISRRHGDER